MRAYCFASGHIEFGRRLPDGALPIAMGGAKHLRDFIETHARHGYRTELVEGEARKVAGSETLLVPGVPEAPNQTVALEAFKDWRIWLAIVRPRGIDGLPHVEDTPALRARLKERADKRFAGVAQRPERLPSRQEVAGENPAPRSTPSQRAAHVAR